MATDAITLLFFQSETNKKDYIQNYYLFEFNIGRNWIYVEKGINHIYFNHPTAIQASIHVKDYGRLPHQSDIFDEMTSIKRYIFRYTNVTWSFNG